MTPGHRFTDDADDRDQYEQYLRPHRKTRDRRYDARALDRQRPRPATTADVTDLSDTQGEFATTYKPARFEKEWLRTSLRPFYDDRSIVDVLAQVKGGKEANVYRCRAHPELGGGLLAAKVYRPQQFRNLSNDALYREGRSILGVDGQPIKQNDTRVGRALRKKTDFGEEIKHASWLMHEFGVLRRLHLAGAPVPEPLAAGDNAILMSYHGDEQTAAPTLNAVTLDADEAVALSTIAFGAVETMLHQHLIHGDLSAYNILYWQGQLTIIDFPQAVDCHVNPRAYAILRRDITRLCDYFRHYGLRHDPAALADTFWRRYVSDYLDESEATAQLS